MRNLSEVTQLQVASLGLELLSSLRTCTLIHHTALRLRTNKAMNPGHDILDTFQFWEWPFYFSVYYYTLFNQSIDHFNLEQPVYNSEILNNCQLSPCQAELLGKKCGRHFRYLVHKCHFTHLIGNPEWLLQGTWSPFTQSLNTDIQGQLLYEKPGNTLLPIKF